MKQVCFTWDKVVALYQTGFDQFEVRYGLQIRKDLNYADAAKELGAAIMHSVACDGRLDSRDAGEAETDGDAEPFFSNAVPV